MSGQSLGLIETVGLTVAVEAADAAMKSANVELVGYELTKGGGLVTVKLTGEVGAINSAVAAGVAAARRVGDVYAWKVIPRTAAGIDGLIASSETCGVVPVMPVVETTLPATRANETDIPVVILEPTVETTSCAEMAAEETFTAPLSVQPPVIDPVEQENAIEPASRVVEDALAGGEPEEKKPLRPRGKTTRK